MLKRIAIALAVLLLIAAGVAAWLWNQATALPEWYAEGDPGQYSDELGDSDGPSAPPQWIAMDRDGNRIEELAPVPLIADQPEAPRAESSEVPGPSAGKPKPASDRASKKRLLKSSARHVLRGFHRRLGGKKKSAEGDAPGGPDAGSKAIKASRAVYEDGRLEIGLIVDLSNIPRDKLNDIDRRRLDRAIDNFPGLTNRDVWIGVQDDPVVRDGYLQLSDAAEVRVGKLTYSIASAAKRVGMKPAALVKAINDDLRRIGLVDPG